MDKQDWVKTKKTLLKIYTLIVDRRFLFYVLVVIFMLLGFPQAADQADAINKSVVEIIVVIAQALAALGGGGMLIKSWTERPPSGLDFDKIVYDKTDELAKLLRDLGLDGE